MLGIISCYY